MTDVVINDKKQYFKVSIAGIVVVVITALGVVWSQVLTLKAETKADARRLERIEQKIDALDMKVTKLLLR